MALHCLVRLKRPLDVPPALSEIELTSHMLGLAAKNQHAGDAVCFLPGELRLWENPGRATTRLLFVTLRRR